MNTSDVVMVKEGKQKAEKLIRESITREQLDTARKYLAQFKSSYPACVSEIQDLENVLKEQDIILHKYNGIFFWKELNLEGFDTGENKWYRVISVDTQKETVVLCGDSEPIFRDLVITQLRSSKIELKGIQ